MNTKCCEFTCPVEATIQLIGGKYKSVILWHLMGKTLRYSEIHKLMPKATDKMLAQQLRELEKDGLINRKVYLSYRQKRSIRLRILAIPFRLYWSKCVTGANSIWTINKCYKPKAYCTKLHT